MLRDFKLLRRNSGKNEEIENVPANPTDSSSLSTHADLSRPPLNTIQDPTHLPEAKEIFHGKVDRTPSKAKYKGSEDAQSLPLGTPEKHGGGGGFSKHRFGWAQKNEIGDTSGFSVQLSRGAAGVGNGGLVNLTPRTTRLVGRGTSSYSESNSTQSTPNKSVSKPPSSVIRNKVDGNFNARMGSLYRGFSNSTGTTTVVNTVEVPHFELKEDPSFWINHNVQVIIRVRPLNSMERSTNGYNRCLKQESAQSVTWIGQPETRFTFDHVACETVDQETLFRMAGLPMVENCLSGYNSCMFAYGQTGSGKTYTMLGEIEDLEVRPSPHRGMTPRIFEFLFARIQAEEESRRDENLKYNCKCSFLEIYNEQITDLLDPSSSNLLLREDVKKGVYVENLSEFEVQTVSDIVRLLTQGSANRKVAATNMNRESSRSHSVFTCAIESTWEKDSTANFRFARLNLVDLAGSERQKSSGAEGERLKEAANINKSLSTLGHVIMVLLDVAHGRPRHVPYRDSRLTFLLQDSLGGNSKTMIIANVSPSICCVAETLNTLKFAQRAKLIQNNAVVNEDSTGDVIALQHQIRLLKEELAVLKRQNVSRSLSFDSVYQCGEQSLENASEMIKQGVNELQETKGVIRMSSKQLKSLETTLAGSLRREQMADHFVKQLEAEIEQLSRLARQREEETRSCKMMLRFREDKIQRMESLVSGSISAGSYLLEENKALSDEIQLLQAKVDRNPEVTRFARENIRLLEQLRRFQEFYEEGEREILLAEVSNLRDQFIQFVEGGCMQHKDPSSCTKPQEVVPSGKEVDISLELRNTLGELEECRCKLKSCLEDNAKLCRECDTLCSKLNNLESSFQNQNDYSGRKKDLVRGPFFEAQTIRRDRMELGLRTDMVSTHAEEILNFQLELDILRIMLKEERSLRGAMEEQTTYLNREFENAKENAMLTSKQLEDAKVELGESRSIIEALESQQFFSINGLDEIKNKYSCCMDRQRKQEFKIKTLKEQFARKELRDNPPSNHTEFDNSPLQLNLKRTNDSLEKAKRLNLWYQSDRAFQINNEEETDEVRRQAEAETAEVIVCMQEELTILEQELQDSHLKVIEMKQNVGRLEAELQDLKKKLFSASDDNRRLSLKLEENEEKLQESTLKEIEMEQHVGRLEAELQELKEKLFNASDDNRRLSLKLEENEKEMRYLSEEWELLTAEIQDILVGGCESLFAASDEIDHISTSFTHKRIWVSEQVGAMVKIVGEKDGLVDELRRCLQNANTKRSEMEGMLKSMREAVLAITETHQQECNEKEKELVFLTSQLHTEASIVKKLEERLNIVGNYLKEASRCATVGFVIVNRLSEDKLAFLENNRKKDALLSDQACLIEQVRGQMSELQGTCDEVKQKLSEEQEHSCTVEQNLKDIYENDFLETKEKLVLLQDGVSNVRSSIKSYAEHTGSPGKRSSQEICSPFDAIGGLTGVETDEIGINACSIDDPNSETAYHSHKLVKRGSNHTNQSAWNACKNLGERDCTMTLLKKEIVSALKSLKEVQDEMSKLKEEKQEMLNYKNQTHTTIQCLTSELLSLQVAMNGLKEQSNLKLVDFNSRLRKSELTLQDTGSHWCQMKELLELEVGDAKIAAAEKAAKASCILAKFEEAQSTINEADIVITELVIANESMKFDIEKLKIMGAELSADRLTLANEIHSLKSLNDLKYQESATLVKQFGLNLDETKDLVVDLEKMIAEVDNATKNNFMSLSFEIDSIKTLVLNSFCMARSWLEDIWSEILAKDCAINVLNLCHMGILLEAITGTNAENGLLLLGLSESNTAMNDLKEHNYKARKELEMCGLLKGKLLGDIKNGLQRISRKEEETSKITDKLSTFERKISDIQFQEEMMLERSNDMGSQLAALMRDLELSNRNVMSTILDQEKILKHKQELLDSEADSLVENWIKKDFDFLIFASELGDMASQKADVGYRVIKCLATIEDLTLQTVSLKVDAELEEQIIEDCNAEIYALKKLADNNKLRTHDLLTELDRSNLEIIQMDQTNKALKEEIELLKNVVLASDVSKFELVQEKRTKEMLLEKFGSLEAEYEEQIQDLLAKEVACEFSYSQISFLGQQNKELLRMNCMLESLSSQLKAELSERYEELRRTQPLCDENDALKIETEQLKTENSLVLSSLKKKTRDIESLSRNSDGLSEANNKLQDEIITLKTLIFSLQTDLEMKAAELNDLQSSHSVIVDDLCFKKKELQNVYATLNKLKEENNFLQNGNKLLENAVLQMNNVGMIDSAKTLEDFGERLFGVFQEKQYLTAENVSQHIGENVEMTSKFIKHMEWVEHQVIELLSINTTLETELSRKDEFIAGLVYDLRLLQESASITKDKKDEIEDMEVSLIALEDELARKSEEVTKTVANCEMLEAQLEEKIDIIAALELNLSQEHESVESLQRENVLLKFNVEDALAAKCSAEDESKERIKITECLEMELSETSSALIQMNELIESLRNDLNELDTEKNQLKVQVLSLKQELDKAETRAEENEVIVAEVRQVAESRRIYAEEKEAEIRLLETSVEELERTINVLENNVDIVKGEAERQRLQREELELELHAVKVHLKNVGNSDADLKRTLDEKEKNLQEALNQLQTLRKDIAEKDTEIAQIKLHVSELNLHAEAQASEYKQKELEAMAEQVKPENFFAHSTSSSSNKSEKNATKSRGSGSPFKCIGMGLAQQIKSEKVEELTAAKFRIEELECLAASRQKEIFSLNTRLAAAESMTHDVIRDLLGVKLDMTAYMSLLDNRQVQRITEKAELHSLESQEKEKEVVKLQKQIDEFIEERQQWLDEIDRKQSEMVAAQIALEKLRQQDQLIKAENEMLKMENANNKKRVMELEGEVNKPSGQQNLQQRINHHAKIKEENNMLKLQNEDLSAKLRKTEIFLSRVKEELARLRASVGMRLRTDFDEEQCLMVKLKETQEENVQLAQKLFQLCTCVLKAAGIKTPVSDISPSLAEEALEHLNKRIVSLEKRTARFEV